MNLKNTKKLIILLILFFSNTFAQTTNKINLSIEELDYIKTKKTVTIANELDWIPYDYYEDGVPKGYIIDYIKLILNKTDLKPIFITNKWSNLYNDFKKGEIDILPVISYNKKREEILLFTDSILKQELTIIVKNTTSTITNQNDLKNRRIGMMKDWNSTKLFKENFPEANVIEFDNLNDIFDAINDDFLDATVQNKILASFYINRKFYDSLKQVSEIKLDGFDGNLFMGVKKDLVTLHTIIQKAIQSLTEEELNELNKKWINSSNKIQFTNVEQNFINNNIINIGVSYSWAPFSFVDKKNEINGIVYEYTKKLIDDTGLKTNFHIINNFEDALYSLKDKEIDLIMATSKTKDRENYAIFSNTYMKVPIGIVTLQDKNYISNINNLMGKKIAVSKNYTAYKLLKENYPELDFLEVKSLEEGLRSVSKGKTFAYIDIMPVLSYNIKNLGLTNLKISGEVDIEFEVKMMIRDDYPILQNIVNKVLHNMSTVEKSKINDKWLSVEHEKEQDYSILWKIILFFLFLLFFVLYKNNQLKQYQKNLEITKDEVQKSLKNFKTLIELNIAGILIIRNKKIVYLNDEIVKILNYKSKNDLKHKEISEIFIVSNMDNLCKILDDVNAYEIDAIKADKTCIPVLLKGKLAEFDNKSSHIVSIIDLSDIKHKEEVMLQQSKMASLGEMIGNIAHQWRQPLSSISTAASGMKLQKEFNQLSDNEFDSTLDNITQTTQFLSQTIDDFQNYIKENKIKKEFDISKSIEKVLSLMKGTIVSNFIELNKNLTSIVVESYENELNQVLLNILSNSKDALKNINEDNRFIRVSLFKKDENAIIEIIDSGGGIDEKIINRVFEPYFTTKHKSQGTGLGLYMTHKIIKESINGNIFIENCSYRGFKKCAKVTLSIPIKE